MMKAVMLLIATVALALLAAGMVRAGAPEYRVGSGCTYATIQDAVDAIPDQGDGIIRIRGGTYVENLEINNKSVELLGGHNDCTTTSATSITHIDASGGASPVITYRVNLGPAGASHALYTDKLNLLYGTGSGTAYGGGISVYTVADRTVTVTLDRTFVRNNQTTYVGGGIALRGEGDGTLALLGNSQIDNNTVTGDDPYGGGLYCQGDYTIAMIGGSIYGNTAGEAATGGASGGGVYLDGCDMTWYAQNQLATSDDAALRNNTVYGQGGGLYATGGAQVDLIGAHFTPGGPASSRPLRIHNNRALSGGLTGGLGGAIYVHFANGGAQVRVDRAWVFDNYADDRGGAFYVIGGTLTVTRGSETCHSPRLCSRVFNNTAHRHAVVRSTSGGTAEFIRTYITGNASTGSGFSSGHDLMGAGGGGTIRVFDSLIHANEAESGFTARTVIEDAAVIRLERSTVADNSFSGQVFHILMDHSDLTLHNSIVHEPGTTMGSVSGNPDIFTINVVWHDDFLTPSDPSTLIADPLFSDPGNGLYYLQSGSPAIDFHSIAPPGTGVDLDWNPRGVCHSVEVPVCPVDRIYDVGAYEMPLGIFSDRFEQP